MHHDLYQVSLQAGNCVEQTPAIGIIDYKSMAPGSVLLKEIHSEYRSYRLGLHSKRMTSVMLGMRIPHRKEAPAKYNMVIRLGITRFSGLNMSNYYVWRDTTLATSSNQTAETPYVDTLYGEDFFIQLMAKQIRLDVSFIFETNSASNINASIGLGINGGISNVSFITISYNRGNAVYVPTFTGGYTYYDHINHEWEMVRTKRNTGYSAYIPIRIEFRLGKKKEIERNLHIFYESRLMANANVYTGLGTIIRFNHQHGIGIRIRI